MLLQLHSGRGVILLIEDLEVGQISIIGKVHGHCIHNGVGGDQLAIIGLRDLPHGSSDDQVIRSLVIHHLIGQISLIGGGEGVIDVEIVVGCVSVFAILSLD